VTLERAKRRRSRQYIVRRRARSFPSTLFSPPKANLICPEGERREEGGREGGREGGSGGESSNRCGAKEKDSQTGGRGRKEGGKGGGREGGRDAPAASRACY